MSDATAMEAVRRQFAEEMGAAEAAATAGAGPASQFVRALRERGKAQEFVAQQYAGRYALELLQNADDAASDRGLRGRVRFVLTETALLVADDGAGFGPEQVRALCTLGSSSKDRSKSIGYKGIGFKSVLEITDTPQVLSEACAFGFDESRVRAALDRLFPTTLLDDHPLPAYALPFELTLEDAGPDIGEVMRLWEMGYTTVIRLPLRLASLRNQVEQILTSTIRPRLLLLTQGLEEITVEGTAAPFSCEMLSESQGVARRALLKSNDGELEEWLVYRRICPLTPDDPRPHVKGWERTISFSLAAAVAIIDQQPRPTEDAPLHVYFPTEDRSGFPIVLHADWALDPDRRHLSRSPDFALYNTFVTERLIDFLRAEVLTDLLERYPDDTGLAECLCPAKASPGAGHEVGSLLTHALKSLPFLPAGAGGLISPSEALLLPSLADASGFHRWTDYADQPRSLSHDAESSERIASFLAGQFRRHRLNAVPFTTLREPDADETDQYYRFLSHVVWLDPSYRPKLETLPCIPLLDGGMGRPDGSIFTLTNERLRTELTEYIQFALAPEPWQQDVLRRLGVEEASWRNVLLHNIVPRLSTASLTSEDRLKGLRTLHAYWRSRDAHDEQIRTAVQKILLPARASTGASETLAPAGTLYFGCEWGDSGSSLESVYGPFGLQEFLAVPDSWAAFGPDEAFYKFIGVADYPRVLLEPSCLLHRYWSEGAFRTRSTARRWRQRSDVRDSELCPMNHPQSQWIQDNCVVDRFDEVSAGGDAERSAAMFNLVAGSWGQYQSKLKARIRCGHGSHGGTRAKDRAIPSLLAHELAGLPWVPAINDGVESFVRPSTAWAWDPEAPAVLDRVVTRLPDHVTHSMPAGMRSSLEFPTVSAAPPIAHASLLSAVAVKAQRADQETLTALARAAEWLLDHLEHRLEAVPPLRLPDLSLPSVLNEETRFTTRPWATHDPILEAAFATALPVLPRADRFPRCRVAFDLPSLDDARKWVHGTGELLDLSRVGQDMVRRVAPLIVAQQVRDHPSTAAVVAKTLSGCVVQCWRRLDLQVQAGDTTVRVPEVCAHPERGEDGVWHLHLAVPGEALPDWTDLGMMLASTIHAPDLGDRYALWLALGEAEHPTIMQTARLTHVDVDEANRLLTSCGPSVSAPPGASKDGEDLPRPSDGPHPDRPDEPGGPAIAPATGSSPERHQRGPTTGEDEESADADQRTPSEARAETSSAAGVGRPRMRDILLADQSREADAVSPSDVHNGGPEPRHSEAFDPTDLEPINHDRVTAVRRSTSSAPRDHKPEEGVLGLPVSELDQNFQALRTVRGRRAEEVVVEHERRRLVQAGRSADEVRWISDRYPFAPYDIESLDDEGRRIYIEVKATQGADPSAAFPITAQELEAARRHGQAYWLYRVTRIDDQDPEIVKIQDLHQAFEIGHATLEATKYRMRIGLQAE